jgi:Uncharacterised nucleotidyltransferase
MVAPVLDRPDILERMVNAVEKVKQRLFKATQALEAAHIDHAVLGGNAVAAWVATIDEAAIRNTRDVDLLVRRADLERVKQALEPLGFVYRHAASLDMFLDGPDASARDAVHLLFAGEKIHESDLLPHPDLSESIAFQQFRVLTLEALVRIKLMANRDKDRTHLRDMIDIGLIDASWTDKYPPELALRLQHLLDTPGG